MDTEKKKTPQTKKPVTKPPVRAGGKTDDYKVTRSVWNDIKSRNKGRAGSDSKVWMMEELEPYMGSFPTTGEGGRGLFPGLIPDKQQSAYSGSGYGGRGGGGGGGGGGGSLPLPPPPFKIRTTTGQRLTPYWESEPDFVQGWTPRLTVLGNTQAW